MLTLTTAENARILRTSQIFFKSAFDVGFRELALRGRAVWQAFIRD